MVQDTRKIQWIQDTVRILQRAVYYLCIIGAIVMLFMMFLTVADVIGRSFFTWPITGTYELSRYFLVVTVLLGIAYAQQTGQHIAVDYFVSKLPLRGQFIFEAIATFLGLVFFALVTWQGWKGGWNSVQAKMVSDTLHIPSFLFEFLIAVGAFFLCIELFLKLLTLSSSMKR
jgi:TRAP-type C4-dicarboxylate transport system permease small subunit